MPTRTPPDCQVPVAGHVLAFGYREHCFASHLKLCFSDSYRGMLFTYIMEGAGTKGRYRELGRGAMIPVSLSPVL